MRKIDINTTHNVTIEYELATVRERIFALLIDLVAIYLGSLIIYGIIAGIIGNGGSFNYLFISLPASFFYFLLMESLNNGQTLGKRALKIRVVKINGDRPGFFDFLMRTAFRFIDITTSFGTVAVLSISSTEKGQRLGDYFADTTVVRIINFNRFSLERILSMEQLKSYTPSFPDVVQFNEEEMLLVKETLERYKKYPNENHMEAVNQLVDKIERYLEINAPSDKIFFLNTLIKDYVTLTR